MLPSISLFSASSGLAALCAATLLGPLVPDSELNIAATAAAEDAVNTARREIMLPPGLWRLGESSPRSRRGMRRARRSTRPRIGRKGVGVK
jgi:hypothetical protein